MATSIQLPSDAVPFNIFASISMPPNDRYRGAVVEDLQLPPAFCLPSTESVSRAMELAYDRDFSHIPVLNHDRRPLGYVDVAVLKEKWEAGTASPVCIAIRTTTVSKYMTKFNRSASQHYTLITPLTPLAELAEFLRDNIFALVTDQGRNFVLAVATSQDLDNFVTRRGR
ncbi:hypothetical protein BD769DRAFT_1627998 [Suillus cothurnatus]|nr:hypothetical protein BD769DRAFT_1627998 [Suillus cothurnatus]